jgi:hypothetical protein
MRTAIYTRFSTDKQSADSTADQVACGRYSRVATARRPQSGCLPAVFAVVAAFAGLGCATTTQQLRSSNRQRLVELRVGMARAEVLQTMGTESVSVCDGLNYCIFPAFWVVHANPYRTEAPRAADGTPVEILYYETETKRADGVTTDDELTPLVLESGTLVGWGWSFLEQNVNRYEIRLR